jgi:murein DD-endopeptidase MepM/ murein hydrolase activator NlpD
MSKLELRTGVWLASVALCATVLAAACGRNEPEVVSPLYAPSSAHASYALSLQQANLAGTALGRDWISAAEAALAAPLDISLPFQETGYFDESEVMALAFRFDALGGQTIDIALEVDAGTPTRIFMDLFRVAEEHETDRVHVASGAGEMRRIQLESRRDASYVLRLQPELLRSARYTLSVAKDASLEFPVAGRDTGAIQSGFGAPRDGGRRSHRGVDIFAPRNTPVVAAAEAWVSRVRETEVGGRVIWLRNKRNGDALYYAHLESQEVREGQEVQPGDVIGRVGNSGNARTTPPHLHFGVYVRRRGARDPYPYLHRVRGSAPSLAVDANRLGGWSRSTEENVALLTAPRRRADVIVTLEAHTPLRVFGGTGAYFRVRLPDGTAGYVPGRLTESVESALRSEELLVDSRVYDRPLMRAPVMAHLSAGEELPVLGSFGQFLYVRTPAGYSGWLATN